jgi:hypothetical protein
MSEDKGIRERDVMVIMDEARNEAQIAILKMQALINMCKDSEALHSSAPIPNAMDIYSIFSLLGDLAEITEDKVTEIEVAINSERRKAKRFRVVDDVFIDLDNQTAYRAEDDYERKLISDFQRVIETQGKIIKGLFDAHRATKAGKGTKEE